MFTKLPFIYFWRDSRQNKGNTEKKRDRLFFKGFIFPKEAGIKFWWFLPKHKTKTYSDFDNSDILIYECLQYPVSSLKAGIMSPSFVWLFVHCLFVSKCPLYVLHLFDWIYTLIGRGNNLHLQVGIGSRVHVASA